MQALPLRLAPGDDLRTALESACGGHAAFVVQGIGSLSKVRLRYAGRSDASELNGDLEILTLAGTVAEQGVHLHISVSDAEGRVYGGHLAAGSVVRTTAEVLLALLPGHRFTREHDAATAYPELRIFSR
ncbi:PPC domain-containing DNA-binding protein [Massilia sp. SM-13]|uniref:PPC domain-containing DNA-binding protein n=1 Tax=Pseudoduganella rhizocola TaxID=3382643 RepID=UPI0038B476CD